MLGIVYMAYSGIRDEKSRLSLLKMDTILQFPNLFKIPKICWINLWVRPNLRSILEAQLIKHFQESPG